MNRYTKYLIALAAAFSFTVGAQSAVFWPKDCPECVSASSSKTDDGDVALVCVYIGTAGTGYVTVAADGNLAFESPDSSTADTTFECPVSAPLGGVIDVSNAACNTVTEVLNIINTPTSNFRCAPYAILGTDDIDISGTGWLKAATDQSCGRPDGCKIVADTDVALNISNVLAPEVDYAKAQKFFVGATRGGATGFQSNPYLNSRGFLSGASTLSTYGSGTSVTNVYSVKGEFKPYYGANTGSGNAIGATYSETVTLLWGPITNGATTVFKTFGTCDTAATACGPEWGPWGVLGRRDEKLLIRVTNSAALATTSLQLNGLLYNYR